MVEVEGASGSIRAEVAIHVKHAVLTEGQELAKLQREIELLEKLEGGDTGLEKRYLRQFVCLFGEETKGNA